MSNLNLEEVKQLAQELSTVDKVQLLEWLRHAVEAEPLPTTPRRSLYGLWDDVQITDEDIDDARRQMWGIFPRDDI